MLVQRTCAEARSVPNGFSMTTRRHAPFSSRAKPDPPGECRSARSRSAASPDRTADCPWSALAFDACKLLAKFPIGRLVLRVALHIGDAAEQPLHHALVDLPGGKFRQTLRQIVAERRAGLFAARDADQSECLGQQAGDGEIIEGGQEQAVSQIARCAEDHEACRDRPPGRVGAVLPTRSPS